MRKKIYIFIILLISLIILLILQFFNNRSFLQNIDYSKLIYNDDFVSGIISNGNYGIFDKNDCNYYYSKNIFDEDDIKIISPYKVKYSLTKDSDDEYTIYIYSDKYYQVKTIKLLNNSIISIVDFKKVNDFNETDFNSLNIYNREYVDVFFQIMDNDMKGYFSNYNSFSSIANLRVRGASSAILPKKSFKLEFPSKKSVLGMDADDDWILDALYMDKSKIRNLLSYDLWNAINDNQYIDNDLNGKFVEVFLNNEYDGLFVIKQKVDSDITHVTEDGFLAKSVNHLSDNFIEELLNFNTKNVDNECKFVLGNLELKKCTSKTLQRFIKAINNYYYDSSYSNIYSDFDMENYINYYIFISFISGVDNVSKNLYYSMVDDYSKILITPWDLDLTWGLDWNPQAEIHSSFSMNLSSNLEWLSSNITDNMDEENLLLMKQRYWDLRKSVFTMDTINNYLNQYKDFFIKSGVVERDSSRWYEYDVEYEIEQIREWSMRRIEFLDDFFK